MKKHVAGGVRGGGEVGRERRVGVAPEEADELAGSVPPPDQGHGLQTLRSGPLIQWREGGGGGSNQKPCLIKIGRKAHNLL
jgi:hypothetical protein